MPMCCQDSPGTCKCQKLTFCCACVRMRVVVRVVVLVVVRVRVRVVVRVIVHRVPIVYVSARVAW
jgi:hypothetical protein